MSTTIFFNNLRSFSYNMKKDIDKMRQAIDKSKFNTKTIDDCNFQTTNDEEFLDDIQKQVDSISSMLSSYEAKIFGPEEHRLTFVTMEEFKEKSSALFEANEKLLQYFKQKLGKSDNNNNSYNSNQMKTLDSDFHVDDPENSENIPPNELNSVKSSIMINDQHRRILSEITLPSHDDDYFIVEDDDDTVYEQCKVQSIYESPKRGRLSEQPTTPSLAEWKLSEATRNLVKNSNPSCLQGSFMNEALTPLSDDCPGTPSALDLSIVTQTFRKIHVENDMPKTPDISILGDKEYPRADIDMSPPTPSDIIPASILYQRQSTVNDTGNESDHDNYDDEDSVHFQLDVNSKPFNPEFKCINSEDSSKRTEFHDMTINNPQVADLDDSDDSIHFKLSPLKTTKILM